MRNVLVRWLWIMVLLGVLCSTVHAQTGQRWALLVGVEQYDSPDIARLDFATVDVKAVADALQTNLGFAPGHVRVMTSAAVNPGDPNRPTNTNVLKVLKRLGEDVGPEDTFVFYFSGHGFSKEGRNFLGTVNADASSVETLEVSAIPMELLQGAMKKLKARQVIFIIDACRNDPEKGKGDSDNLRTADFSKSLIVASKPEGAQIGGSAVLFACAEGERAFEDPALGHSAFTYYLLDALQGKAAPTGGALTMTDVADYVQKQVTAWARDHNKKQTPQMVSEGQAKIVLADQVAGVKIQGGTVQAVDTRALLLVTSDPPGAVVLVDKQEVGKTPLTLPINLGLDEKRASRVAVTLAGYEAQLFNVTLERGKSTSVGPVSLLKSQPAHTGGTAESGAGGGRRYTGANRPENPQRGDIWVNPKDGAELVFIPAGSFLMGDDDVDFIKKNNPRHTVTLSGYWIYKNVVTVKQYKQFCQETSRQMPPEAVDGSNHFNPNWSKEDHPIVNVSWDDAKAYCDWAGVRLPTEAEWEKAARGTEGKKYPWGDEFDNSKLWCRVQEKRSGTAPAGAFKDGASPYGALDMAGNVWQWCSDYYDASYWKSDHGADPTGPPFGDNRVLRGSSWYNYGPINFRSAVRGWFNPAKGVSSTLVRDQLHPETLFRWQEDFAVFSLGRNQQERVLSYINNQKQRHASGKLWPEWEDTGKKGTI